MSVLVNEKLRVTLSCANLVSPARSTLITASMYQLTTYIDNVSTGQLSSDQDLQRLVTRLKGDMLNAKEHGIQSMRQQTKSMGQQDFHDLQSDIRAFTTALRHLLDTDIQDIRKYAK